MRNISKSSPVNTYMVTHKRTNMNQLRRVRKYTMKTRLC
jgi:hypothetical protein